MGTCPTENVAMCSLFAARSPIMFVGGALIAAGSPLLDVCVLDRSDGIARDGAGDEDGYDEGNERFRKRADGAASLTWRSARAKAGRGSGFQVADNGMPFDEGPELEEHEAGVAVDSKGNHYYTWNCPAIRAGSCFTAATLRMGVPIASVPLRGDR